jgi:hypothetical protein
MIFLLAVGVVNISLNAFTGKELSPDHSDLKGIIEHL